MVPAIHDLDELVLRCRDKRAKEHIREAVACYRSGAIRSSIVATWIAVVFDFVSKLHELEIAGDKNAAKHLAQLEKIRARGESGIPSALAFERDVLETAANEFELLTPLEKQDLTRLLEDRNRCAHPTMQSAHDHYKPTAELARTHIRNAVELLLQREPVQGKAALDRVWADISSKYFPTKVDEAQTVLAAGPLSRARNSLIRSVVIGLTKTLLKDSYSVNKMRRMYAALGAVMRMHRATALEVLDMDFSTILGSLDDDQWGSAFRYFARIDHAWHAAGEAMQHKARAFLSSARGDDRLAAIHSSLNLPIKADAVRSLQALGTDDLEKLILLGAREEYCAPAARAFCAAGSHRAAKELGEGLLVPIAHILSTEQIRSVVRAFLENEQIRKAWGVADDVLPRIFEAAAQHADALAEDWALVHKTLQDDYFENARDQLQRLIEDRFPELRDA